jgi:hypothetical protein
MLFFRAQYVPTSITLSVSDLFCMGTAPSSSSEHAAAAVGIHRTIRTPTTSGWSSDINDYIFIERLPMTVPHPHKQWHNSVAVIYRTRLTDDAVQRAIANGVPHDVCHRDFAVKIVYNFDDGNGAEKTDINELLTQHVLGVNVIHPNHFSSPRSHAF